jgi:hypothetical protein
MTAQILELYWRDTRMGGITDHVVVCPTCRSIIPPYSRTSSSGGTHGVAFYDHPHPVAVLSLIQSNKSMNRHHGLTIPEGGGDDIKALLEEAGSLWDVRRLGSRLDVEEFVLNRLSNTAPHEGDMLEKFIELLPPSSTLLKKFAKALFMKRRNVPHEEWGMTEEEATEAVETLSRLLRLGRP